MIPWNTEKIGSLKGYDVIVTGGSSGIGLEAAKVLAAKGFRDSFVVAFLDGKRITIDEAKKLLKN